MKKLFKALTALAIAAGIVGASLVAAAPASAAPPVKPTCYEYTWNVETLVRIGGDYTPAFSYTTEGSGSVTIFNGTGAYISGSGDATVKGRIASDFPLFEATFANLTIIDDNDGATGVTVPVGVIEVDLDANGTVDTTLGFDTQDTWAQIAEENPWARVKYVGFDFGPNASGYYYLVNASVGPFQENFYYQEPTMFAWKVTGTGQGPVVPGDTATTRYVVTGQVAVPCKGKPGK